MQPIRLDVRWRSGRTVTVLLEGTPMLEVRTVERRQPVRIGPQLARSDIVDKGAFYEVLARSTRVVEDGGVVEIGYFDPLLPDLFELLAIEPPPPPAIAIELGR
ncbi:hypothetical protein [Conexibacter sp. CPCC 206217]|uniref:hypothetical protein n=1 Tax=Conexibacter sp. CPCC 206217 TaxID=3064574 RepID=UPI0027269F0A|nr:hypothetical protein [Conexibacter sp. CPCC 206217]MDO8210156.1 hypothetical protein [Conexibacter sp. CPCC 206217]